MLRPQLKETAKIENVHSVDATSPEILSAQLLSRQTEEQRTGGKTP